MRSPRVYRHWPFLAGTVVCLLVVAGWIGALGSWVARHPDIESVVTAALFAVPLFGFAAFLVLVWRVRTVVDDTGVTQHWILRGHRIPFGEITAMEPVHVELRWFLRIHCGERTFEVIPCHTLLSWGFGGLAGPARALVAAWQDIEQSAALPAARRPRTARPGA